MAGRARRAAVAVLCSLLAGASTVAAQVAGPLPSIGSRVRLSGDYLADHPVLTGQLVLADSTLLVVDSPSGTWTVLWGNVRTLDVARPRRHPLVASGRGAAAGLLFGAVTGTIAALTVPPSWAHDRWFAVRLNARLGVVIGAVLGATLDRDRWAPVPLTPTSGVR
jgi:hypothetical protein